MNESQLRTWIMMAPRPSVLRLTVEGNLKTVPINEGATWAAQARSVKAQRPELIEALDDKGQVLRAARPDEDDEADLTADAVVHATRAAVATPPAMVDTATLQLMARLLADAYKHSTETAFARLADLFAVVTKRSENLERSLALSERAREREREALLDAGATPEEASTLPGLIAHLMQGQAMAKVTPPTNGKG